MLEGGLSPSGGGSYIFVPDMPERYMADLLKRPKLMRPLKAVVSCGNGTAGAFAPRVLAELGVTVVPLNCELDYTFPAHNPNPEDLAMLNATREAVLAAGRRSRPCLRRRRRPLRRGRQ